MRDEALEYHLLLGRPDVVQTVMADLHLKLEVAVIDPGVADIDTWSRSRTS